jgi:two-component system response regulator NreC
MSTVVRIIVVHPDNLVRVGIRALFNGHKDLDLVGEAADYDEIHQQCQHLSPHILLISASIPSSTLAECIGHLRHQVPPVFTVVLASAYDEAILYDVIQAGAAGYIVASEPADSIVSAIRVVMEGGIWFSQTLLTQLMQAMVHRSGQSIIADPLAELTERERQVLQLMTHGWTNQRIGLSLGIAERTIRFHLRNIFDKLNFKTRGEAIAWAIQDGQCKRSMPSLPENGKATLAKVGNYKLSQ